MYLKIRCDGNFFKKNWKQALSLSSVCKTWHKQQPRPPPATERDDRPTLTVNPCPVASSSMYVVIICLIYIFR